MLSRITWASDHILTNLGLPRTNHLQRTKFEGGEVEVGRFVLDLVLVLPLLLAHVLEVEDRPPLGVVEACRPVEHAQEEEARCGGSNHLETMAPSDRSEGNQITDTDMI